MRRCLRCLLATSIALFVISCTQTALGRMRHESGALERLESIMNRESLEIDGLVRLLEEEDAVWAKSDLRYYSYWLDALVAEQSDDLQAAIEAYQAGSQIERYEMDNYSILLPLGRALLRDNQIQRAHNTIEIYVRRANADLVGDHPWVMTEEARRALEEDIATAEWLLIYASIED